MSLIYDIGAIPRDQRVIEVVPEMEVPAYMSYVREEDGKRYMMDPVLETIIFGTMSVGLGQLTEENMIDFMTRWIWVSRVSGISLPTPGRWTGEVWNQEPICLADLKKFVGIKTNVTDEPVTKWMKRIGTMYFQEIHRDLRREEDLQKAAADLEIKL